jgi:3-hydroxyacyl-CoA dehydrogenase
MKRIHKVAILGAGTMGARIAAHFANAGLPSFLLDIVPADADAPARNKIAAAGLDAAKKSRPAAFMDASLARLVTVGNFEDDLKKLSDVDWIIEAVVENLEIKRALLRKIEAIRKPGTIITTNTSGLPVGKIAEGFSDEFRKAWFGTHFFNPPRYMRLLEIIPTPDADRAAMDAVAHFSDVHLGKGVVLAKDTPNFIGNRIGTFSVLNVMRLMQAGRSLLPSARSISSASTFSATSWGTRRLTFTMSEAICGCPIFSIRCCSGNGWATKPRAAFTKK